MDYLLTFVELSLGLAGVAALIAVFRDHKKRKWRRFQFLGLIMHAMIAFVFSLLPFLVNAFTKDLEKTWAICSGVLFHLLQGVLIFVLFILGSDIGITENKQDNISA